jgi:hypothetical protein
MKIIFDIQVTLKNVPSCILIDHSKDEITLMNYLHLISWYLLN